MRQFGAPIGNALEFGVIIGERIKVVPIAKWRDGAIRVAIAALFGYAS